MTFEFKSFEHFKQVRIKAAQWRAFDKQLKGAEGEELIRGVLQEPVIDNKTDRDYEKRLYEGFKEGMRRLREGVPLVNKKPPKSPPKDQFREAWISLGYLPPPSSAAPLSSKASSSPPSSPRASPSSPNASVCIYPSLIFQRTPSPLVSPSSSVLLKATPPCLSSPPPIKTPTRIFNPSVQTPSLSPTPPPTPRDSYCQAYSDRPSSEKLGWYPATPSPMGRDFESASFQPAIEEETKRKTTTTLETATTKPTPATAKPATTKPAPKRKRRKQQLKFSDEALKKVRPSPPAIRRSKAQSK